MQISEIKRPALIEPFFNLEIDFKNDYVEYIPTTNQNAVTPHSNNIQKNILFLKANSKKHFILQSLSQNNALSLM
ncbi:MAG: hypothetical protein PHX13_12525 [Thiovulaceae bacterium]|nr:hypothetical protein [Sulfurimonadaceae bacterium]